MNKITIGSKVVGPDQPVFIIAEAGVNHNGDLETARRLVDAGTDAGADAVKFQTFRTENIVSLDAPKAEYQSKTTGEGESQFEMLKRLELPFEAFRELQTHCRSRGVVFMSTPFDAESADFLAGLDVAAFKMPSGEITNLPFLAHVAGKGKPMIVSTGMSFLEEVAQAVETIRRAGCEELILLHCVSNYPADPADVNLRAMATMAEAFGLPVGYSDHTLGIGVAMAAAALGACVIEKHFTLDRALPGPDHRASLEPGELAAMVGGIRDVSAALGGGCKKPASGEADTARAARKSLVAACDIAAGTVLSERHVAVKRPGTGLAPSLLSSVIGRAARRDIPKDTVLAPDDLE